MLNSKSIDLTCIGILVLDALGKTINEFPAEGTSAYFDSMQLLPGGCAYNTGVDARRLGLHVSIQGKVGNDQFGDVIIDFLKKENVSTNKIKRGKESTAFSFVMIPDSGQRRIYHTPGANNTFCLEDIDFASIEDSKVMHIGGSSLMPQLDGAPTIELLKFCKENNVVTSMDPVFKTGIANVIVPALPYLDIFLPNTEESQHITGFKNPEDQLNFYLDRGVGIAGIKMGEKGVLLSNRKEKLELGVYKVRVEDTCGAGDAFIAAFIYGTIQGWKLQAIAEFATAAAAYCVQSNGATSGIVKADEIIEFTNHEQLIK